MLNEARFKVYECASTRDLTHSQKGIVCLHGKCMG